MNLQTLKEIANENISLIFDSFSIEYVDRYSFYQCCCPIHGGDNPTAFSWVKDRGYFRCFTRKCERDGADVFDFVQKYKKCTLSQAKNIVASIVITGDYKHTPEQELIAEVAFKKYIKNNLKPNKQFEILDPALLKNLKPDKYLLGRGFSQEVLDEYNIGYCDTRSSVFYGRTCIPVFHHDGHLVGFTARAAHEEWKQRGESKWIHTAGLPKGQMLFNLNKATNSIRTNNKAIITEGPLDILRLWMAGAYNAVAVLGTDLSGPQRSLLLARGCFDLLLAFDADIAGIDAVNRIKKTCSAYFNIYQYILPKNKDIGDLSVEEINNLDIIKV